MSELILTGTPDCSYCDMLESIVKKLDAPYLKVDVSKPECSDMLAKVKADGNRMPACMFVGEDRYVVTQKTPARLGIVKKWLSDRGIV